MKNFDLGVHWKIQLLCGEFKKSQFNIEGDFLKQGGAWTVCRFKGRGAAGEKEVGVFEWEVTQLFQLEMTHCGSKISHKTENYS